MSLPVRNAGDLLEGDVDEDVWDVSALALQKMARIEVVVLRRAQDETVLA